MHNYFERSKTFHYSIVLTAPLLVLYELGIFLLFKDSSYELRNTGEVVLRNMFSFVGITDTLLLSVILVLIFLGIMLKGYHSEKSYGIRSVYFLWMMLESFAWAVIMFFMMKLLIELPLQIVTGNNQLTQLNLAVGAGIFEELVFRAMLIPAFIAILVTGIGVEVNTSKLASIILSAIIFAFFHLFMETFDVFIFIQRFVGGLFLGTLYLLRGYGIASYTHILFNIMILIQTW